MILERWDYVSPVGNSRGETMHMRTMAGRDEDEFGAAADDADMRKLLDQMFDCAFTKFHLHSVAELPAGQRGVGTRTIGWRWPMMPTIRMSQRRAARARK